MNENYIHNVIFILQNFTANNYIWKSINTFGSPPIDVVLPIPEICSNLRLLDISNVWKFRQYITTQKTQRETRSCEE